VQEASVIPARKSATFGRWFSGDAQRRIMRSFGSVRVGGLDDLARLAAERPVLVVSNHTSWWDPLVILYLTARVLKVDAYAMMDAKNLRALPFFGKVGAFGVDLDAPADGARAIRYAAKLLDRAGRLVWIFPQGREVPVTARPLGFRGGSAEIARVARQAVVVPAAIRYEHGGRPEPSIFVAFGAPLARERDVARARHVQEAAVVGELDRIDRALLSGDLSELPLLHERKPGWLEITMQRVLAWMTGPASEV
jgi:1-acyl-sn-glycerol-3-phosphate acyltransferase